MYSSRKRHCCSACMSFNIDSVDVLKRSDFVCDAPHIMKEEVTRFLRALKFVTSKTPEGRSATIRVQILGFFLLFFIVLPQLLHDFLCNQNCTRRPFLQSHMGPKAKEGWTQLHVGGADGIGCQHFQVMITQILQKRWEQCTWQT